MKAITNLDLGIMQGRLCDKPNRELQSFPQDWVSEFYRAREYGFTCIEWLFDTFVPATNPLTVSLGSSKTVRALLEASNVQIRSCCFHFLFLAEWPLLGLERQKSIIKIYCRSLTEIGCEQIVWPITMRPTAGEIALYQWSVAQFPDLKICVEFAGRQELLLKLLNPVENPNFLIALDVGNLVGLGLDLGVELRACHEFLGEIHLKDKTLQNVSTRLGHGAVNFDCLKDWILDSGWAGLVVLETPIFDSYSIEAEANSNFAKELLFGAS